MCQMDVQPPAPVTDRHAVTLSTDETGGDLSGLIGAVLVLYIERALGPIGVKEVMDRVGADEVVALVEQWEEWVNFEVVLATAIAVAELCHEPDIGRRTGEELFRVLQERGLMILPSDMNLVDSFPDVVHSLNTATELRQGTVVECENGYARIEVSATATGRTRFLCRLLLGLYSLIPTLRQATGAVVETRCIHRGDEVCEFQVRWRTAAIPSPGHDPWTERVVRLQNLAVKLADDEGPGSNALVAAGLLEEIRREALRDPLTGLPNRAALELRARDESAVRGGTLDGLTLLFVDLDGFKAINDTWGHAAGDQILKMFAARLQGAVRDSDLVARLGGDEFVVLFPEVSSEWTVERLVHKVFSVFKNPYPIGMELHSLAGSIGVSRAPEHGQNFNELLDHADRAMYRVKKARKENAVAHADAAC